MVQRELSKRISPLLAFVTLTCCLTIPQFVRAQVVGGSVSGTVIDAAGSLVPGAAVLVMNVDTGVTSSVSTNSQGAFNLPNLLPGNYQATITAAGFETTILKGITLTVGLQQVLNIKLKVGSLKQDVEVSSSTPELQLSSSTISGTVQGKTIVELPLNGRSWTDLATLQPGVSTIHAVVSTSSTDRLGRGLGNQLSISGGRPQQNNYVLDGISINDYSNQAPGSILGGNLGADAVGEFTVLTSNYGAEYGRTSGGVISAATRSGTNRFHGSAYEFLRNSSLDARNYFDGATIPEFRRNQFGAAAGGPIRKNKTFIFGDYESLRQALGLSMLDQVPSALARQGTLCDPSTPDCSKTIQVAVDPKVGPYLGFYPLPNAGLICAGCGPSAGDTGYYNFNGSQITNENYFTLRVDQKFSDADGVAGTYMFDNTPSSQNDEFNNKLILSKTFRQLVTVEENHVFGSSMVNSLRFGYNHIFAAAPSGGTAINPLAADTSLGFTPGQSAGAIGVAGLTSFSGGLSTTQLASHHWNSFQLYENLFLTRGDHSLKFGVSGERVEDNTFSSSSPGGNFQFNSLSDFLTNQPNSLTADVPNSVTPRDSSEYILGAYVQDDFHFRPSLTLNLGLRYEMATIPREANGRLGSLHSLSGSQVFTGSPLLGNPSLYNLEPRVGFAWDATGDGKLAVRAGFGVFDVLIFPADLRHSVDGTVPFALSANGSNLAQGSFPSEAYASLSADPHAQRAAYVEQHPSRNYVMQWNLNLQRQLTANTTAMLAYVGSRGVHNLFQADDASIVLPIANTPDGYLWPIPNAANPLPVLNPNFGRVAASIWNSDSIFHALEAELKRTLGRGLEYEVSYTFGKSIDASSGSTDGDQFQNGLTSLLYFAPHTRRGLSDFNIPQNLTVSYTWNIPGPQDLSGAPGWALHGWQWGGIFQASSGAPFSTIIGPDPLGMNSTDPFDFPGRAPHCNPVHGGVNYLNLNCFTLPAQTAALAGQCQTFGYAPPSSSDPGNPGIANTCANLLGNSGRNSIPGPRLVNYDFSLFKNNPVKRISESFNVQFRVEIFNLLNHANFNPPTSNGTIFDGSGQPVPGAGQITSTATTSRQVQFALKFLW
jgi:Carboxypeptidase regulatory-like domain/TonB-dependent Receptor Plug Domain/TonB dependent receptor